MFYYKTLGDKQTNKTNPIRDQNTRRTRLSWENTWGLSPVPRWCWLPSEVAKLGWRKMAGQALGLGRLTHHSEHPHLAPECLRLSPSSASEATGANGRGGGQATSQVLGLLPFIWQSQMHFWLLPLNRSNPGYYRDLGNKSGEHYRMSKRWTH